MEYNRGLAVFFLLVFCVTFPPVRALVEIVLKRIYGVVEFLVLSVDVAYGDRVRTRRQAPVEAYPQLPTDGSAAKAEDFDGGDVCFRVLFSGQVIRIDFLYDQGLWRWGLVGGGQFILDWM